MRSYIVNTDPVKVSVNGITFDLLKTDAQSQAEILQYLIQIESMDIRRVDDVQNILQSGCELIDSLLGGGACYRIFGKTPISLGHISSLLLQICKDCAQFYRNYLKNEYLEG